MKAIYKTHKYEQEDFKYVMCNLHMHMYSQLLLLLFFEANNPLSKHFKRTRHCCDIKFKHRDRILEAQRPAGGRYRTKFCAKRIYSLFSKFIINLYCEEHTIAK